MVRISRVQALEGLLEKESDKVEARERIIAERSKMTGVHMEVLYEGGPGVSTFRIDARIDPPATDAEALRHQIADTSMVLRDAYNEVRKIIWP